MTQDSLTDRQRGQFDATMGTLVETNATVEYLQGYVDGLLEDQKRLKSDVAKLESLLLNIVEHADAGPGAMAPYINDAEHAAALFSRPIRPRSGKGLRS